MGTTCDGKGEPCFCWQHFWLCGSSVPRGVPEALQQMADLLEAAEDPVPEDLGAQAGKLFGLSGSPCLSSPIVTQAPT